MSDSGTYTIRPAGRHILTIGRELVQSDYAAIIELVKNSYDADSPDVKISLQSDPDKKKHTIIITDHGHGMTRDTVVNKWMVPSTRDKLDKPKSPAGRTMQGRKGIGRYSASMLGNDLLLETVAAEGEKTTVFIDWKKFEDAQYLHEVEILIETKTVTEESGTKLTITRDEKSFEDWDGKQIEKLRYELKKLKSPVIPALDRKNSVENFSINLVVKGIQQVEDINETIESFPVFDLFDYRIRGQIENDGEGKFTYSQQKAKNSLDEEVNIDVGTTYCGKLIFDIRVYDREPDAIQALIDRGLKGEGGDYLGKNEAKQLLNSSNGIGVYRNGFRIRPLGDADFDWLKLNEQRVQNPSMRIGSNQVIGYVQIQSENLSGLIEKSARDGLKENKAFNQLKKNSQKVIAELETLRYQYRKKAGLSRHALKIERELERLFSFDGLKKVIQSELIKENVDRNIIKNIVASIDEDLKRKNEGFKILRDTVAIYQGQATLGKIINVILHEGRRPLSYFKNQIPNLQYWYDAFLKDRDSNTIEKFLPIAEGIGLNANVFVKLFSRLDPLGAGKRSPRKPILLKNNIDKTFHVFEGEMRTHKITYKINGSEEFKYLFWTQDLYAIFTNLIDNSIYWMNEKKSTKKEISIDFEVDGDSFVCLHYRDTGPGIEPNLIESEVIFEPQFSTKPNGTGLGLAIVGEAANRNGLELRSLVSETGAYFILQPKGEN